MSKIGRRPIDLYDVQIQVEGQNVLYKGKHASGSHLLPSALSVEVSDKQILLGVQKNTRLNRQLWGLHRAILSNKILGSHKPFVKEIKIVGLGYKVQVLGNKLDFSLGFSHKKEVDLPKEIVANVDKSGQLLTLTSFDKEVLGKLCGELKKLRPVEPYKGTGVRLATDVVIRKAGKTKSA